MSKKAIGQLDFKLSVSIKKEGSTFIAYTPALDIATDGRTKDEARKNFAELVEIFFEEFKDNADALDIVLGELGWTKQQNNWNPPKIDNIVQDFKVNLAV